MSIPSKVSALLANSDHSENVWAQPILFFNRLNGVLEEMKKEHTNVFN
jgi:hypothetical protein